MRPLLVSLLAPLLLLVGCDESSPTDDRILGEDDMAAMISCDAAAGTPITAALTRDAASDAVIELPTEALAPGNAYM